MLALCLMLSKTYHAQNYAGIIGLGLFNMVTSLNPYIKEKLQHNDQCNHHHVFIKQSSENLYDMVFMLIWYEMMHKFSYEHNIEHNIEHNTSTIRALHPKIMGENLSGAYNCANLVIKNNKVTYKLWHNCSSRGLNIEHNRQIFEHCSKA